MAISKKMLWNAQCLILGEAGTCGGIRERTDLSDDERILRSQAARAPSSACCVVEQGLRVLKIVEGICLIDGFVMTNSYSKIESDGEILERDDLCLITGYLSFGRFCHCHSQESSFNHRHFLLFGLPGVL